MKHRVILSALGLAFGLWEAIDIFQIDAPTVAAAFAAMFLAATTWFWLRESTWATLWLLVLFAFEAAVAPSLKHVEAVTKVAAFSLGVTGAIAALTTLTLHRRQTRDEPLLT